MNNNDTTSRIQQVCKKLLIEFIRICDKHHLRYYLIDGSLLGAIRHQGFIPWDDDMDLAMPRPDYEKFCKIAKNELPDNMYFVSYEESLKGEYLGEIAHMYCRDMQLKMDYFTGERTTDVWIDIMILYGMPEKESAQKRHFKGYYYLKGLARMGRIQNIGGREYSKKEKLIIGFARKVNLSKILNTEKLLLKAVKHLKKYPYDKAKAVIVVPSEYGINEVVPKDYYEPPRRVPFEDTFVNVPSHAEEVLTKLYGNYMKFPPENERQSKHKVEIIEHE